LHSKTIGLKLHANIKTTGLILMARPRKSEQAKQQLLDVGVQMLTEQGYHGTGIKQILDAVGVPKGSFYNFFPSKEAFVASIIYQYGDDVAAESLRAVAGLEQEPALIQLWYSFYNKVRNREQAGESCACLLGALSAEIAQASTVCNEALSEVQNRWIEALERLVEQAQQQGDISRGDTAKDLAQLIYNCWQGGLLQYQVSGDTDALLKQFKTLMNSLLTDQGANSLAVTSLEE
jgi:TetR/AcrR family transcriptional repressor of nem operon